MNKLNKYNLPKGQEIYYIKRFVNGVDKAECEYMFLSPIPKIMMQLAIANITSDIAFKGLRKAGLINKK